MRVLPGRSKQGASFKERGLDLGITAVSLALVSLPVVLAFLYIRSYGVDVVFWDQWAMVERFESLFAGTLSLSELLVPYNEHRLLFPQIFMLLLGLATDYNVVAEMYAIQVCSLITLLVLWSAFRGGRYGLLLFAPVAFVLFSYRQHESWLQGMQVAVAFALTFSVISFRLLHLVVGRGTWGGRLCFLGAAASATIASFSFAQGLFVWPAGLLQLLVSPLERKAKARLAILWSVIGAIAWFLYFFDFDQPGYHPKLGFVFSHPIAGLQYFLTLTGSSLFWQQDLALGGGIVLICVFFATLAQVWRAGGLGRYSFWLGVLAFSGLFLLSTTAGRAGFGVPQAVVSRYTSFSVLAVAGLYAILALLVLERRSLLSVGLLGAVSGLVLLSLPASYSQGAAAGQATEDARKKEAFLLATHESQPDDLLTSTAFPDITRLRRDIPILDKYDYSSFSGPNPQAALPPLSELSRVPSPPLAAVDGISGKKAPSSPEKVVPTPGDASSLKVGGWAVDERSKKAAGGVYVSVDGELYPAFYGLPRPDVAQGYGVGAYRNSGFERAIPLEEVGPGRHEISLVVLTRDRERYYEPTQRMLIDIKDGRS